uniref:Uncharacterized protein n=1 Tax=Anguilla anguilla TaxID=7936 RepID=A0A0E9SNJ8_ANGAN
MLDLPPGAPSHCCCPRTAGEH